MANVVTVVVNKDKVTQLLGNATHELKGRGPIIKDCLRVMGIQAMEFERAEFLKHSKPGDTYWAELGIATIVLRRHGGGQAKDEAGVEAMRGVTAKLRDTNRLMDSLFPRSAGNVFRVESLSVTVGTNAPGGASNHFGLATEPFVFTPERKRNFKNNVSMTTSGSAPDSEQYAEATGTYYDSRTGRKAYKKHGLPSPWNPFYFKWLATFKKWDRIGRRGKVPRRKIIVNLSKDVLSRMAKTVKEAVGNMFKKGV
jgi:hypothetical protein